jgi:predicted transcriptional regulator YdeE
MTYLEPKKVHIETFNVSGLSVRTINSDEFNPSTAKLPSLWQQFAATEKLQDGAVYGVYSDYETDDSGHYTVTAGMNNPMFTSSDFTTVKIDTGDYLVFEDKGPMPQTVIETWKRVWSYFTDDAAYKRSYTTDFELYNGPDSIAIYIKVV